MIDSKIENATISTHTLTWSVTIKIGGDTTGLDISTHTLTWSVTVIALMILMRVYNFNSHAHVERDLFQNCTAIVSVNFNSHAHVERDVPLAACFNICRISTHTLTWSVTGTHQKTIITEEDFNSHAHVERDVRCAVRARSV